MSMAGLEPFAHKPLDSTSNAIRTLRILPDPEDVIVRCSLKHGSLQEDQHVCLSYMCGDPNDTETIVVNEHSLDVYRNCGTFLSLLDGSRSSKDFGLMRSVSANQTYQSVINRYR